MSVKKSSYLGQFIQGLRTPALGVPKTDSQIFLNIKKIFYKKWSPKCTIPKQFNRIRCDSIKEPIPEKEFRPTIDYRFCIIKMG